MMKKKSMLIVPALLALLMTGCSQQDLGTELTPNNGARGKEIRLVFSGGGESQEYTRAIASESENQIDNLYIYVFAATADGGDYQYLETWKAAANDDTATKTFKLSGAGTQRKASIFPTELKGIPHLKLYCVANSTTLYKADGNPMDPLVAVTTDPATGDIQNAGTKAEDFEKLCIAKLDPAGTALGTPLLDSATPDDVLLTPLPMVGSYSPALDLRDISMGSRTRINMTLSRIVSRFDIINDAEKSHLTITSVSMGKGRKGVTFFPVVPVEDNDPAKTLITYPDRDFDGDNANKGTQTGAFYSYPSPIDDKGYLIIKGKYALNLTDAPQDVSYMVEFEQSVGGTGGYIEVKPNHRYTVRITDADPFKLDVNITVSDWTDGGDFD